MAATEQPDAPAAEERAGQRAARTEPVTAVFSRRVRPGHEAEFEDWAHGVIEAAILCPGHLGASVLHEPGSPYSHAADHDDLRGHARGDPAARPPAAAHAGGVVRVANGRPPAAVVLDLDGVLIEGEEVWDDVRRALVQERGGRWAPQAQAAMMGMSSPEWSRYMAEELGLPMTPAAISDEVVARVLARYAEELPLVDGAVEVVRALADRWPLGLASSANRPVIDLVLGRAGLSGCFRATVSSEEVARGKPAPDVYLAAAARLGVAPAACVAVEDSANGLRAAAAAGMRVVAVPNRRFPPPTELVAAADLVVARLRELTPEALERLAG